MSIILLLRYIKGYVEIKVYNGFIERFINLCTREKVKLWDLEYKSDCLIAKISRKDLIKIKNIRKKSGTQIKILRKFGYIYLFRRYKERKLLPICSVASALIMLIMNMFVWSIDVVAEPSINEERILASVEHHGLKIGTFTPLFNQSEASRASINDFNGEISWLAINIKGSKATIEVREFEKEEEKASENQSCNYISDFDGIIIDAYTYEGEQKIFPGASVNKGTMLISGITENEDGSINYHVADGIFTAQHSLNLVENYTRKYTAYTVNEFNSYKSLYFFGVNIPLKLTAALNKGNSYSYSEKMSINGNTLPLGIKTTSYYETAKNDYYSMTDDISTIINVDGFTLKEYKKLKNSRIINAEYIIKTNSNQYLVQGNYECIDFIGKKSVIIKEN